LEKDFGLSSRVVDHMVNAIKATPVDNAPCQHAMLTNVFPDDIYQQMLGNIPRKEAFRPMSLELFHDDAGVSTRDLIELPEIGVERIAAEQQSLWWAVGAAIMSEQVKAAVFNCISEDLAPVLGCDPSQVNDHDVFVSTALRVETESYHMPPHFDEEPRIATMLLYLPQDDSLDGLGTSLYEFVPKWKRAFRPSTHKELRRAPFLPNTGMYFSGNPRKKRPGWHGFERVNKDTLRDAPRISLLTTWYTGTPETHAACPDIVPVKELATA